MSGDKAEDLPLYEVRLSEPAEVEIEAAYLGRMRFGLPAADRWYAGLVRALESLAQLPRRHPVAPESDLLGGEVHQMIYGTGLSAHGILYRVLEPEGGSPGVVRILHVRHAARQRRDRTADTEDAS